MVAGSTSCDCTWIGLAPSWPPGCGARLGYGRIPAWLVTWPGWICAMSGSVTTQPGCCSNKGASRSAQDTNSHCPPTRGLGGSGSITAPRCLSYARPCAVQNGRALAEAGLHPATGGDGLSLCSGDMLLEALAACAGVTLRAVATSLDIPVAGGTVHVEGDLDFRGTLAVSREAPVGFRSIRLRYSLDITATTEQLDSQNRLTESYF